MTQLIHFNRARKEIELAKSIDEVKKIKDKAEALRAYAKQAGESLEMQNSCAEIKLRAERRIGEYSKKLPSIGHRPKASHDGELPKAQILKEAERQANDLLRYVKAVLSVKPERDEQIKCPD